MKGGGLLRKKEVSEVSKLTLRYMTTQDILQERGQTHGDFSNNARVSQALKATLQLENADLTDVQQEAIDMICHKLARIAAGNPNFKDHWDDIAGYATLAADRVIME